MERIRDRNRERVRESVDSALQPALQERKSAMMRRDIYYAFPHYKKA